MDRVKKIINYWCKDTEGKTCLGRGITAAVLDTGISPHPDLKGIFACNDNMALAAVQALQEMGNKDVMVYGVDYTTDAKAAIEDGTMMGSMTYSSAIYTKAAEEMAMLIVQGKTFKDPVYLPLTLVTQDNVADFEGWK